VLNHFKTGMEDYAEDEIEILQKVAETSTCRCGTAVSGDILW
jgi:hypothetical protein